MRRAAVEPGTLGMWQTPPSSLDTSGVLDMVLDVMTGIGSLGQDEIAENQPHPTQLPDASRAAYSAIARASWLRLVIPSFS